MVAKNTDKVEKLVESAKQFYQSIPSGAAKSGRVWKEKNSKFSNLLLQKSHKTSWERKMNLKKAQKNVKAQEAKIKQDRIASRPQRKKKPSLESNRLELGVKKEPVRQLSAKKLAKQNQKKAKAASKAKAKALAAKARNDAKEAKKKNDQKE